MAKNLWCIATSHPLVDQVAKKYNITRKQARIIINNSRAADPVLKDDNITLEILEEHDAFKEALGKYVQHAVEDSILFKEAPSRKEDEDAVLSILEDELGEHSREEAQSIMNRLRDMDLAYKLSKDSSSGIARVFKAFKDPRRLEFVGDWITRKFVSYGTVLEFDKNTRDLNKVPAQADRAGYFTNPVSKEVITDWIIDELNDYAEELKAENPELSAELTAAAKDIGTMLYLFGGRIFREEGIRINPAGNTSKPVVEEGSSERNDSDEEPDDEEDAEIRSFDSFSTSQQDKSVSTKILPSIKTLLNGLYDVEKSGEDKMDQFGYGMPVFLSPAMATNTILKVVKGCWTYNQMIQRLEKSREAIPWIGQVIDALSSDNKYGSDGILEVSEPKKEQLRTAFFRSFRKSFTQFRITQKYTDKDGNLMFLDRTINAGQLFDRLSKEISKTFRKKSGATIFSRDPNNPGAAGVNFSQIENLHNTIGNTYAENSVAANIRKATIMASEIAGRTPSEKVPNLRPAIGILSEAEKTMRGVLTDLGIKIGEAPFTAYLTGGQGKGRGRGSLATFNDRVDRLNNMVFLTTKLLDAFDSWKQDMDTGKTTDNPATNPFAFGEANSPHATAIRNWYNNIFDELSEFNPDSIESMTHQGGKSFYSWNNPSFIQDTIDRLSNASVEERRAFIRDTYCKDSVWYMKPGSTIDEPHFYSEWLENLYWKDGGDILQYAEKVAFCDTKYGKMSDLSYALSMMSDYFSPVSGKRDRAWYRMLIASDKPRYSSILFSKNNTSHKTYLEDGSYIYAEDDYHSTVTRQALDIFAQEIRRSSDVVSYAVSGEGVRFKGYDLDISKPEVQAVLDKVKEGQNVTWKDVVKNGKYIFKGTGASFYMNKFIISEIENNTTLGKYAIDKIFNQKKNQGKKVIENRAVEPFRKAFQDYMSKLVEDYYNHLKRIGAFRLKKKYVGKNGEHVYHLDYFWGSMQAWHFNNPDYINEVYGNEEEFQKTVEREGIDITKEPEKVTALKELTALRSDIEEFIYNNWSAKANMSEVLDVDLAFYGDTVNFQKRNAQTISSGYAQDPDARIHGELVSDGINRSLTLKTKKETSLNYYNIKVALDKRESLIDDPAVRRQFQKGKETILRELKDKIDTTDGQSYTALTAIRKRMVGQGLWTRSDDKRDDIEGIDKDGNTVFTDEAVYQRFLRGKLLTEDYLHVFQQVQKPFVYALSQTQRSNGRNLTYPVQHKNSECALIYLSAFVASDPQIKLDSQLAAISKFMEETAQKFPTRGIDTVNWDSSVKIGGNNGAIDLSGLNPQKTFEALQKAVYDGDKYKEGVVTEYPINGYRVVQEKPEHFKHNRQPAGSQKKILAISNIRDDEKLTLDGKEVTGKEMKKIYFNALATKTARSMRELKDKFGLDMPHSKGIHVLSNTLKNLISSDQKFDVDARRSLNVITVDDVEQFNVPLDESGLQFSVEASLMSQVRKAFYRQHTNGGIVPQLSAWGVKDDLYIRFYSSNPNDKNGLVPTRAEFKGTDAEYEKYLKDYQTGFAYFETEITMNDDIKSYLVDSDGVVKRKYINKDGSWNMTEIEKVVPAEKLYLIAYYMPTEGKNSMMLGKAVRFAPEGAGSRASYTKDLTKYSGKDFDIDTTTVELYPIREGNPDYEEDRILFDCQLAALRSQAALGETFKYGEFADLSETSYYVSLLETGKYTPKQLDAMDFDTLKKLCMEEEDMDLMSPLTDSVLYKQNSEAKDMIAIAAVGVTSHAFWSIYNDVTPGNPRRDPKANPENFLRMKIRIGNLKAKTADGATDVLCESFEVVNDKDPNNVTSKAIGYDNVVNPKSGEGEVFLDMMYDMDGKLISDEVGKYVGASADAAKDAAEYRLNITLKTLPILILMHRMGISSDVARMFLAQPAIREVSRTLNSASAFSYAKMDNIIDTVKNKIVADCGLTEEEGNRIWEDASHSTSIQLRYSDLIRNIAEYNKKQKTESDAMYALQQLHVFSTLVKLSNSIRNLDSFPRYNSHNAMRGTGFIQRYVRRDGLSKLESNLNADNPRIRLPQDVEIDERYPQNEFGRLCSMFPHIAEAALGEQELFERVILDNMRTYSPTFFEAIDKLGLLNDTVGQETAMNNITLLYEGWKSYLLFAGENRIADFHDENTVQYYTRDFANLFERFYAKLKKQPEYADVVQNNTFLESIQSVKAGGANSKLDFDVLSVNSLRLDSGSLEKFKRDWEALLKYPRTAKFATDIAIHFLARASAFSRDGATMYMPLGIKKAIPNYLKALREGDKSVKSNQDFMNFLLAFMRNNAEAKGIVPRFWNNPNADQPSIIADEDNGMIIFDKKKANKLLAYTHQEDASLRIDIPVINVDRTLYAVVDDEVDSEELEDGTEVYVVKAVPVSPLGVPGVMSEYIGYTAQDSILEPGVEALSGEELGEVFHREDPILAPMVESYPQGNKLGSFIYASPYGEDAADERPIGSYLPRNSSSQDTAYIEGRKFIRRVNRVADALGFKVDGVHRTNVVGTPTYQIEVIKTGKGTFYTDQHEEAKKLAALTSALGLKSGMPFVKTYVQTAEEANTLELTVPVTEGTYTQVSRALGDTYFEYEYDTNSQSITVNLPLGSAKEVHDAIAELEEKLGSMIDLTKTRANYVVTDYLDADENKTILNNIVNEDRKEAGQEDGRKNPENTGRYSVDNNGRQVQEVTVGDLAALALRKAEGEKVNDQIRELFGEAPARVYGAKESYASAELADGVVENLQNDVLDSFYNAIDSNRETAEEKINDVIVNIANWIRGNMDTDALTGMLSDRGMTESATESVISVIKRKLDELDIC